MPKRSLFQLAKDSFRDFAQDECPTRAAALSYYVIFALPPLLVLIILVASIFIEPGDMQRMLAGQMRGLMGEEAARGIDAMMSSVDRPDARKGLASLVSIGGLLFGATGAFIQLQSALNRAWEVQPDPEQGGVRTMLLKRVLSLGMILGVAFLLLVSLALSAVLSAMGQQVSRAVGGGVGPVLQTAIDLGLSLVVITTLFAAIFKVLPDARIAWRDVWVGAGATAALFVVGKFLIGFYLGRSDPGRAFGAAGSLALVLVWIYYSSLIVLLGAEFTQAWAVEKGAGIEPEKGAIRLVEVGGASKHPARPGAARPTPVVLVRGAPTPTLDAVRERNREGGGMKGPSPVAVAVAALVDRLTGRARR